MTFTDDDLRALKHQLSQPKTYAVGPRTVRALVARLEAAEEIVMDACVQDNVTDCDDLSEAKKAWRKEAGR